MSSLRYEVVVVGAGTAGAAAAGLLAAAGLKTALLDARPMDGAGARWVAAVPPRLFDQAGLARPTGPECVSERFRQLIEGPEPHFGRVAIDPCPAWQVDLPRTVARLQQEAAAAGATLYGRARLVEVHSRGERPVGCTLQLSGDALRTRGLTLSCELLVDASGLAGAVRRRVPALARACPDPLPHQLCHAVQQRHRVADVPAARRWHEERSLRPGDFLARNALAGSFSTYSVQVDPELRHADLLTGTLRSHPGTDAAALMRRLEASLPWLGRPFQGGSALIPIRRAYARLAVPGAALVGDAACQVFPSHASGVGGGLVGARLLTDAVIELGGAGSAELPAGYQARFHRGIGAIHAAHDAFRVGLGSLSEEQVGRLVELGLINPDQSRTAMDQSMPPVGLATALAVLRGAARDPVLTAKLAALPARMFAAQALSRKHPAPGRRGRRAWARALAAMVGNEPDQG